MAMKIRKTFALVMVICMLTSMLSVQALAEETATVYPIEEVEGIEGSMTVEGNHITVEFFPAESGSADDEPSTAGETIVVEKPEGTVEWESGLTLENGINPEVEDIIVTEEVNHDSDPEDDSEDEDEDDSVDSSETDSSSTTTIVTETVIVGTEGTLENGQVVEGEESYTETTITTETVTTTVTTTNGSTEIETETITTEQIIGVVEGNETITEETFGTLAGTQVDVSLSEDDPETEALENVTVGTGAEEGTVLETEGEKPEQLGEGEYDYSETVVKEQGSVTITTTDVQFSETIDDANTTIEHTVSTTTPTDDNDLVYSYQAPDMYLPGYEGDVVAPEGSADDNYGYTYVGAGNTSMFMPSIVYSEPLDEAGKLAMYGENAYIKYSKYTTSYYVSWLPEEVRSTIAKDDNGNYILNEEGYLLDVNGNRIMKEERTSVDPEGNTVYLHRFDNFNGTMYAEGWYEDGEWQAELNGDESFAAIWAGPQQFILVDDNGNLVTTYCADVTTPTQDNFGYNVQNLEDASYYSDEMAAQIRSIATNGYWGDDGNLDEMRANLLAAGFTADELESLTDGVALTATQMAIWSCSNKMSSIQFINSYYSAWGVGNVPEDKEDEVKLLFKLYDHLTNLDPTEVEGNTADTVITKDNFVDEVSITVIEKVEDAETDQDDDKDVYRTNVSFALVVKPSGSDEDNLIVQVVDAQGNVLASGRIAGTPIEGEEHQVLEEVNGNYTFEGIEMTEGDVNFKLTLTGIQHLQEGVYLYSSEVKDDVSSQTLVGKAGGNRDVNVEMNISFNLDVNDEIVVTERVWRDELDPVTSSTTVRVESRDVPPPPVVYRLTRGVGQLETIIDEEVPLAEVPQTGDNSIVWFALILMSVIGLCVLNLSEKKCKA